MRVSINSSAVTSALIVMAVVSLLVMVSLTQIDHIVHGDLYNFGLRFSYRWAMPYWINSGIIVILSLFNIVASIALTYYVFKGRKGLLGLKAKRGEKIEEGDKGQHELGEYVKPPERVPVGAVERSIREPSEEPAEVLMGQHEELIETQIREQYYEVPKPQVKRYDVRHPKDVVDSQC